MPSTPSASSTGRGPAHRPVHRSVAAATVVTLGGHEVELVRKRVKRVTLRIYPPDGRVRLTAPGNTPLRDLARLVTERSDWIERHRKRFSELAVGAAARYLPGETHYLRGIAYTLARPAAPGGAGASRVRIHTVGDRIVLHAPADADLAALERAFARFYRNELASDLAALVTKWERGLGVKASAVGIKRMSTRWGSCNTVAGRLWFNLELAKRRPSLLECVVVHELVHLLVADHGPRFKALMTRHLPEWRALSRELEAWPLWARLPSQDAGTAP